MAISASSCFLWSGSDVPAVLGSMGLSHSTNNTTRPTMDASLMLA